MKCIYVPVKKSTMLNAMSERECCQHSYAFCGCLAFSFSFFSRRALLFVCTRVMPARSFGLDATPRRTPQGAKKVTPTRRATGATKSTSSRAKKKNTSGRCANRISRHMAHNMHLRERRRRLFRERRPSRVFVLLFHEQGFHALLVRYVYIHRSQCHC